MKYIIDIEDKPFESDGGEKLYRAKRFKSLVFDQRGLDKLQKINEQELEEEFSVGDEVVDMFGRIAFVLVPKTEDGNMVILVDDCISPQITERKGWCRTGATSIAIIRFARQAGYSLGMKEVEE